MELAPSWEAASRAVTEELPKILWNPKDHYSAYNSPPLVPILSQPIPVHTNEFYPSKKIRGLCQRQNYTARATAAFQWS
jgi:hypothetical protein